LIVDQSTNRASEDIAGQFQKQDISTSLIYFKSSERGLVRARNLALDSLPLGTQYVHFIDDDTELFPDYISELRKAFVEHADVVGAAGQVVGTGPKKVDPLLRLIGMDSYELGKVLKTGVNIGAFDHPKSINLDWLPGCCMSFDVKSINDLRFDERRSVWALGEDVDFSLRVAQRGLLVHVPDAKLFHHLSPVNRDKNLDLITQDVVNRWTLAKDNLGRVSEFSVLASSLMLVLVFLLVSIKDRDSAHLRRSWAVLRGLQIAVFSGGFSKTRFTE
jgi:GT2 family glycosyltransferase